MKIWYAQYRTDCTTNEDLACTVQNWLYNKWRSGMYSTELTEQHMKIWHVQYRTDCTAYEDLACTVQSWLYGIWRSGMYSTELTVQHMKIWHVQYRTDWNWELSLKPLNIKLTGYHSHKSHKNSLSNFQNFFQRDIWDRNMKWLVELIDFIKVSKA